MVVPMYVETVPNRNSRPAVLLREGWREGGRVRKRTLANLTDWPAEKVRRLRQVLKGQPLVSPEEAFIIERSLPHGHVEAVLAMTRRLELDRIIAPKRSPERDRVLVMVVGRLLHPGSKLAATRWWHTTTLARELDLGEADEDDLYEAINWLLARRERIERHLAQRHLHEGASAFADVSGSCYEGLADIERWFRILKDPDIRVRPIRHREERRVRAHPLVCLLAGYLEWHLRRAWAPLLFDDETLPDDRRTRDPVAPAEPTARARHGKASRRTDDGAPLHSLDTLLRELATRCRNTCRVPADPSAPPLSLLTEPTPIQRRAAQLIESFPVPGSSKS